VGGTPKEGIAFQATLVPGEPYAAGGLPSDRLPPGGRNPDPDDLDRLVASLDHLTLCCCEPGTDEADNRRPPEAVAMHKQFIVGAMPAAGEQL
jgi:hypothetical protein